MPPSPSFYDTDRPLPYIRLIIGGILLLTLFIIASLNSTVPADEDVPDGDSVRRPVRCLRRTDHADRRAVPGRSDAQSTRAQT